MSRMRPAAFSAPAVRCAAMLMLAAVGLLAARGIAQERPAPAPAATASSAAAATAVDAIDAQAFARDLAALTARPNRLAGMPDGSLAAGQYVLGRLKEMGFTDEQIIVQPFPVVQSVTTECRLIVDGQEQTGPDGKSVLYPVRPNLLQPSITPAEGLTGQTVYAGKGTLPEYPSLPQDKIVILDFDSARNWQIAFSLGAKAVVFVGGPQPAANVQHHVNVPANFPRFYIGQEAAAKLDLTGKSREITIKAAAEWRQLEGRNILAIIRGQNQSPKPETVVLAAPLDTAGEVPDVSPAAREAANCALLLQVAGQFRAQPPMRDVVIAFFDGQYVGHEGARAFYGAFFRSHDKAKVVDTDTASRVQRVREETVDVDNLLAIMSERELFREQELEALRDAQDQAFRNVLRLQNKQSTTEVLDELAALRLERRRQGDHVSGELLARIESLDALYKDWNGIQRIIHQKKLPDDASPQTRKLLAQLIDQTRQSLQTRKDELTFLAAKLQQDQRLEAELGMGRRMVALHISLNLGDARNRWTFIHGDDSEPLGNDTANEYKQAFRALDAAVSAAGTPANFEVNAIREKYNIRLFAPALYADSGAAARIFGVKNIAAMTVMDRLQRQAQPCDTSEALAVPVMLQQAATVLPVLRQVTRVDAAFPHNTPSAKFLEDSYSGYKASGPVLMRVGSGSAMADLPVRGAMVAMMREKWDNGDVDKLPPAWTFPVLARTDANGIFQAPPFTYVGNDYKKVLIFAAMYDKPLDGSLSRGLISSVANTAASKPKNALPQHKVEMFRCRSASVVGFGFERGAVVTLPMPDSSSAKMRDDRHLLCEFQNVLTLFAHADFTGYKLFNKQGLVLLDNGPEKKSKYASEGDGLSLADPFWHPVSVAVSAHDIDTLNKARLDLLRRNRINQDSLDELSEKAISLRTTAAGASAAAASAGSIEKIVADLSASAAISRAIYTPLVGVMNDLVTAVVLLLLLAIPFGYALERLLVGTPHIYRQIGWFTVFFLMTFALLYAVNPAFSIAATPVIIFLAFAIILLSSLVIFIMMRKLQTEVRRMQGLASTVHSADVSRLSTMMAAVNMGISTMRRRPLRTLLTATTVVLLTFTILTFASFGSSWGTRRTYQGPMTRGVPHIMVRHQLWNALNEGIFDTLRGHFRGEAVVAPRYWVAPIATEVSSAAGSGGSNEMLISSEDGKLCEAISAAVGLDAIDLQRQPDLAALLKGDLSLLEKGGVFITPAVADKLKLSEADIGSRRLLIAGRSLLFAGTIDNALSSYTSIEGSMVLPVDYQASGAETKLEQMMPEGTDLESAQFNTFAVDKTAVVSTRTAREMKGRIRSITMYPTDPERISDVAQRAATVTQLPVYLSERDGGVYRLIFTSLAEASGVKDLLIPVLLGGMIVFATMLGSVSDREREIYTFSSLGLAPPHVASLFFAEASMYAVIGGMGGYLLGQVVARLLGWLGSIMDFSVPTMNYSSTNAIVTVLIVMFTVMISAAYPAIKASRSANPGVQRQWKIPKPQGNLYDLVFPFTVSAYDITGVVSFLKEHFENFSDASLGVFATTECSIFRQAEGDMLGFKAKVALAPFDLGVNQSFAMLSQPSDIEGINEVRILIHRLSGAQGDWQRANRVFINDLRKQLLIWRSLAPEVTEHYRQLTQEAWATLPREQVDAQSIGGTL